MSFRIPATLALAASLLCALATSGAEARSRRGAAHPQAAAAAAASFADERECVSKGALDASDCHNAAMNAHAEYQEKAPRLDNNDACTRFFGPRNCSMRLGGGAKGISFVPSFRGFRLIPGKGKEMMVLPVLAGSGGGIEFSPRPVSRLEIGQDAGRAARAQAAWQAAHAPVIRSAGGGGGARGGAGSGASGAYREAPKGAAPDLSDDGAEPSGPAATYPVSPAMLKAMHEEMRKYGTPPPEK